MNHELQMSVLRKKHSDAVADFSDQLEQLQKLKTKSDKDKTQMVRDLEEANANADAESRQKQEIEKHSKMLEMQFSELQTKADEQVAKFWNCFLKKTITISKHDQDKGAASEALCCEGKFLFFSSISWKSKSDKKKKF